MSTLLDQASLILTPNAYKAGTLYSVKPEDGVGDFDFTRATTATRVNSAGLIETVATGVPRLDYPFIDGVVQGCPSLLLEPARTNLLAYSEDFSDNTWNKVDSTVTLNQGISPAGQNNATLYTATTSSDRLQINFTPPPTIKTFCIFLKSYNNNSVSGRITFAGLNDFNFTTTNEWQLITTTRDEVVAVYKVALF